MKPQLCLIGGLAAAGALGVVPAAADEPPQAVTLTPQTPSVSVPPAAAGRHSLDLPALEYSFDVDTRCGDDRVPESLSLSIADTRVSYGAGDLSGSEHHEVVLRVPARQLAPITVGDFCLAGAPATAGRAVSQPAATLFDSPTTVKAVALAQASLVCRGGRKRTISYAAQPLDVTLTCDSAAVTHVRD